MWDQTFMQLYERCQALHASGDKNFNGYYSAEDRAFLDAIGCKYREFYDFVEDFNDYHEPAPSSALLIAAVRRDYFLTIQKGVVSGHLTGVEDLPTFGDMLEGIDYLPRILAKARAKLRGELDPDIMFGCGGDRNFLRKHGDIHPADFLRHVWAAGDEDHKIASLVKFRS